MTSCSKFEMVIVGYVRECEQYYSITVPAELKMVILLYYPKKINYNGKFIAANTGKYIKLLSNHSFGGYRSAKLDQALPVCVDTELPLVYRWKGTTNGRGTTFCIFGVVSNRCIDLTPYPFGLMDAFGITMTKSAVYHDGCQQHVTEYKGFNVNDIIIIEYKITNINKCALEFYLQLNKDKSEFLWSIALPNDDRITAWFPVFSQSNTGGVTTFIPFQNDSNINYL